LKNGDVQALKHLYKLFYKPTYQAAFFITKDAKLAEDAVHEVFLKILDKIHQLDEPSKLEAWLCRMASNTARNIVRRRLKSTLFAETWEVYLDNQLNSPEKIVLNEEEKRIIRNYINRLIPGYKLVVYLKYYRDMTVQEISTVLGIPSSTVKSRLLRARKEVKKMLQKENSNHHQTNRLTEPKGVK